MKNGVFSLLHIAVKKKTKNQNTLTIYFLLNFLHKKKQLISMKESNLQ